MENQRIVHVVYEIFTTELGGHKYYYVEYYDRREDYLGMSPDKMSNNMTLVELMEFLKTAEPSSFTTTMGG